MPLLSRFDGEWTALSSSKRKIDKFLVKKYVVELEKFQEARDLHDFIIGTYGTSYHATHLDFRIGLDYEDLSYIKGKCPEYSKTLEKLKAWIKNQGEGWKSIVYWSMEF